MTTLVTDLSTSASDCAHTWFVDSPNGPLSKAVCGKCGGESLQQNSIPETGRQNNNDIYPDRQPASRGRRGPRRTYIDDGRSHGNDLDPYANRRSQQSAQWDPLYTD